MKKDLNLSARNTALVLSLTLAGLMGAATVQAKTFKWASAGEISTWDIHSQNNALQNGLHAAVYESLV
jgi:peptide/nickel transport system substrate-binding protein